MDGSTDGGQGREFDSSCDCRLSPRFFFRSQRCSYKARVSLSHATSQPQLFSPLPLYPYLSPFTSNQQTDFPSPPSFNSFTSLDKQRTYPPLHYFRHRLHPQEHTKPITPGTPDSLNFRSGIRSPSLRSSSSSFTWFVLK